MRSLLYLYWPVAVVLMAAGQGLLLPAIRRTPPGSEARRQGLALHYVLVGSYYLALVLAPATWVAAVGARLLLFDLTLNLASGEEPFRVGSTALADRGLQWVAGRLGVRADRVRLGGWVLCLVSAAWALVRYWLLM